MVEQLYAILQLVVAGLGFVAWMFFLPQITRIVRTKDAAAMSLVLLFGSTAIQYLLLTFGMLQGLVDHVWSLVFMYGPGAITLTVLTIVTIEMKKNPGSGGAITFLLSFFIK